MLRALSFSLLSLALLAGPASAQTTPASKKAVRKTAPTSANRNLPPTKNAMSATDQSGYAAPGEPIIPPTANGKNTPPYDGPAAGHGGGKTKTTLQTPK